MAGFERRHGRINGCGLEEGSLDTEERHEYQRDGQAAFHLAHPSSHYDMVVRAMRPYRQPSAWSRKVEAARVLHSIPTPPLPTPTRCRSVTPYTHRSLTNARPETSLIRHPGLRRCKDGTRRPRQPRSRRRRRCLGSRKRRLSHAAASGDEARADVLSAIRAHRSGAGAGAGAVRRARLTSGRPRLRLGRVRSAGRDVRRHRARNSGLRGHCPRG